jgi:hypothetical protein
MKFFKNISHTDARHVAFLCAAATVLLAVAYLFSSQTFSLSLTNDASTQAATTVLGDLQGLPLGLTGEVTPDYTLCWWNSNYFGQKCRAEDKNHFYGAVFSAYSADDNRDGKTVVLTSTWHAKREGQVIVYASAAKDCDNEGDCTYDCSDKVPPAGYNKVAGDDKAQCYAQAPGQPEYFTGTTAHYQNVPKEVVTAATPLLLDAGQDLVLDWACQPKRTVNEVYIGDCTGIDLCHEKYSARVWQKNPLTNRVVGTGSGFSLDSTSGAAFQGKRTVKPPAGVTTTYTLECRGFDQPVMKIPVKVNVAVPNPILTIKSNAPVINGVPTVAVGQSTVITATYKPQSADGVTDKLVAAAINGPNPPNVNTSAIKTADWDDPVTQKTYTFTPTQEGDFVFTPAVKTTYHPDWNNYRQSVKVHVAPKADVCTNIDGYQTKPPVDGYVSGTSCLCNGGFDLDTELGTCSAPDDVCRNIQGKQTGAPTHGYVDGEQCLCDDGYTLDTDTGVCRSEDVCSNIPGVQVALPSGAYTSGTRCLCDLSMEQDPETGECYGGDRVDLCKGTDFPGVQTTRPANSTRNNDGTCSCLDGFTLTNGACLSPTISAFYANPTLVRSGNTSMLYWQVTNPPRACQLTGTDGTSRTILRAQLLSGSMATNAIRAEVVYTLRCGTASKQATVRIIPTFQEI